jgi:hypothetical protein
MTKKQYILLFSSLFVLALIFTNPSETIHVETVKSKLKAAFKKKMATEMIDENSESIESIGNGLGLLLGDTFIEKMTEGFVSRNNFLLFSTTIVEVKGNKRTIGFGILGNVFITDEINNIFNESEDETTNENNTNIESNENANFLKTLKGKITSETCYGPPNWGEDPENDQKSTCYFIQLDEPSDFGYLFGDDPNYNNIKKIHLFNNDDNIKNFKDFDGQNVEIYGEVFEGFNGYHQTPIMITVKSIK